MHGLGRYVYADSGVYEGQVRSRRLTSRRDARSCGVVVACVCVRASWRQWADSKMHGKGVYVFPNGNKYDGMYGQQGRRRAVRAMRDGRRACAGEWQDDVKEGYGTLVYVNGERYEGYWKVRLHACWPPARARCCRCDACMLVCGRTRRRTTRHTARAP
jgi:hypothetical protein